MSSLHQATITSETWKSTSHGYLCPLHNWRRPVRQHSIATARHFAHDREAYRATVGLRRDIDTAAEIV